MRLPEDVVKVMEEGRSKACAVTIDGNAIRAALDAGDKRMAVAKCFSAAQSTVYRMMNDVLAGIFLRFRPLVGRIV